jgi:predicted nucleic acid-binding protein
MIALDTNVLIYACDKADPARQKIALDLLADAWSLLSWGITKGFPCFRVSV